MRSRDPSGACEHEVAVAAWFERVVRGRSIERVIQAFERAFAALWERSHLTLGEVTLMAITDRVLHNTTEQYPILAAIELTTSGLHCVRPTDPARCDELSTAISFVLVEFLTVLGNLTAQILSPALWLALANVPVVEEVPTA